MHLKKKKKIFIQKIYASPFIPEINFFKINYLKKYSMNPKDNAYDWIIKLLIIGDSNVGKTNILLRACDNKFLPTHLATIG